MKIFHLAIPTHDIALAKDFYTKALDAKVAREYNDRVTLQFFEHQIVCHLAPDKIDSTIEIYPRHFGMTFVQLEEYEAIYYRCKQSGYPLYKDKFIRWPEKPEKHSTFFIADPSNNLLEFKFYYNPKYIY